jgi:hypothetical protein
MRSDRAKRKEEQMPRILKIIAENRWLRHVLAIGLLSTLAACQGLGSFSWG